jgi:hypothetical protein
VVLPLMVVIYDICEATAVVLDLKLNIDAMADDVAIIFNDLQLLAVVL